MADSPQYKRNTHNWRTDSVGRVRERYSGNRILAQCWEAALGAGVPEKYVQPSGANDPRVRKPDNSEFSEYILRAFEAANGRAEADSLFPPIGLKPNLRDIAENLDFAGRVLVNLPRVGECEPFRITEPMVPLGWLVLAAELQWWRSEPGSPNPLLAMDAEFRQEANERYPVLSVLWLRWRDRLDGPESDCDAGGWLSDEWLGSCPSGPGHDGHGHGWAGARWWCQGEVSFPEDGGE